MKETSENKIPCISVLMCVYNGGSYLKPAIESIRQQNFDDFECIIVEDGSSDGSRELLLEYALKDQRFRILQNERNMGLIYSLNKGLNAVRGKYLLRMDADDICRLDRFKRQIEYMEKHKDIDAASCYYLELHDDGIVSYPIYKQGKSGAVAAYFMFFNPILHPGVIAKSEVICSYCYDAEYKDAEDLELWIRMLNDGRRFGIQEEYLMLYRKHGSQSTAVVSEKQRNSYLKAVTDYYERIGVRLRTADTELLSGLYFNRQGPYDETYEFLQRVIAEAAAAGRLEKKYIYCSVYELLTELKRAGCGKNEYRRLARLIPAADRLSLTAFRVFRRYSAGASIKSAVRSFSFAGI